VSKETEVSSDFVIPRAADRAAQFLGVIQKACRGEGLDLNLQPTKRSFRDSTVVLRADIKAGRGNQLQLEVFADPQGNALHVGWQATRETVGGDFFGSVGMLGEINRAKTRNASKAGNQRALSGILQAFDSLVFQPVVQQLLDVVRAQQSPHQNGFLGA
jgi:hypothetical protein